MLCSQLCQGEDTQEGTQDSFMLAHLGNIPEKSPADTQGWPLTCRDGLWGSLTCSDGWWWPHLHKWTVGGVPHL